MTQAEVSLMMSRAREERELTQLLADNLVLRLMLSHYKEAMGAQRIASNGYLITRENGK